MFENKTTEGLSPIKACSQENWIIKQLREAEERKKERKKERKSVPKKNFDSTKKIKSFNQSCQFSKKVAESSNFWLLSAKKLPKRSLFFFCFKSVFRFALRPYRGDQKLRLAQFKTGQRGGLGIVFNQQ